MLEFRFQNWKKLIKRCLKNITTFHSMKGWDLLARTLFFGFGTYHSIVEGATCCKHLATLLSHVGCCCLKFAYGQIWTNNTHHVTTHCNMCNILNPIMLRHVALKCCDCSARAYMYNSRVTHVFMDWPHKIFSHLTCSVCYVIFLARKANEYSYAGKWTSNKSRQS